jgi:hypothetical protein
MCDMALCRHADWGSEWEADRFTDHSEPWARVVRAARNWREEGCVVATLAQKLSTVMLGGPWPEPWRVSQGHSFPECGPGMVSSASFLLGVFLGPHLSLAASLWLSAHSLVDMPWWLLPWSS